MRLWLLLGLALLIIAPPAFSAPYEDRPERVLDTDEQGKPAAYNERTLAYWIWRDSTGYHLRTTTENRRHVFSGWVELDRDFVLQTHFKQEGNDYVRKDGRRIEFRFSTAGNADGFDFRASWPYRTTFSLEIDGRAGNDVLDRVFVGSRSVHPKSNPFSLVPAALRGLDAGGRSRAYRSGEPKAYWIWQERDGFHVRVTTNRQRHVFSGWIEGDGGIDVRRGVDLERRDFVVRDGKRIYFHLVVEGAEDGFDFTASASGVVTFFLMVDGDVDGVLTRVFVGREGVHPRDNPFRVRQ